LAEALPAGTAFSPSPSDAFRPDAVAAISQLVATHDPASKRQMAVVMVMTKASAMPKEN
jgi:hypothetical protein